MNITREHLDTDNYYIGPDVSNYDGDIELEANLGVVKFKDDLVASGSILVKRGTDIMARRNIRAGVDIMADGNILSSGSIFAKRAIDADASIEARESIEAGKGIRAGLSIKCKTLSAKLPVFAGTATWTRPSKEQTQIRCEQLHGKVAYGELVLKGEVVA